MRLVRAAAAGLLVTVLSPLMSSPTDAAAPAVAGKVVADRIGLPRGFMPEGIAADGRRLFSWSLAGQGIAAGRIAAGRAEALDLLAGTSLRGMLVDPRTRWLSVVGGKGDRGKLWVVAPRSHGAFVTSARLRGAVFPNDLTFTEHAVWVTDSGRNVLYRVRRPSTQGLLPEHLVARTVRVRGVPPVQAGEFALNGIRTLPGGRLVAVDSRDGTLYVIRRDGTATPLPVRGDVQLSSGDGLVRHGRWLFVVRGQGGNEVVRLRLQRDAGALTASHGRVLTDDDLSVPSTAVWVDGVLWLANARFGIDTDRYYLSRLAVR
jgi:hypothetical protein